MKSWDSKKYSTEYQNYCTVIFFLLFSILA